jgi:hypothetical protein
VQGDNVTTVELHLQDAGTDSGYLLEQLLDSCTKAEHGGAIFAWTNAAGAKSFLEDENFVAFVEKGTFELVIGLDSITDEAAVKVLVDLESRMPNLSIRAFLHDRPEMFHPKLAWFASKAEMTLLVGSGNLTMGGLKNNWEAYTVCRLAGAAGKQMVEKLEAWILSWSAMLIPISDARVLERARRNTGNERTLKRPPKDLPKTTAADSDLSVLVAEIPKSGSRVGQVNFDLINYVQFFGAKVDTQRRITLYHVAEDGSLGDVESRPSVARKSRNYSFELAAMRGVTYPANGAPIGVFMRLEADSFLYMLILPDSAHYATVSNFLKAHWSGNSNHKRRYRTTVGQLKTAWNNAPLWQAALPAL